MPLVLVQNVVVQDEAHNWNDVEGVHYHYPSKYRKKIRTGEQFVYYRGVNRPGGKRVPAEYFGTGRIGEIWEDPDSSERRQRSWYCSIEDYQPFAKPVLAKVNGISLEDIPRNLWRDGVRVLEAGTFEKILELAGFQEGELHEAELPTGSLFQSESLLIPSRKASGAKNGRSGQSRRSKNAKKVGDWAEARVMDFLEAKGVSDLIHREAKNERPGWDIDFVDQNGVLQCVEVKGTVGAAFSSVDFTANELKAARQYRDSYQLFLVAKCLTENPLLQIVQNPASRLEVGDWSVEPISYNIRFGEGPGS
jgi:Holliday junction resolvase-like predicted endonuclease